MLKKRLILVVVVIFLGIVIGWFGRNYWVSRKEKVAVSPPKIVDDFGYEVTIIKKPERIISLSPANTEILFAIGAGDKVVGVTEYCDFPPEVKEIDKVGGYTTPNIEAIVAKNPDLVVASYGNGEENIKRLKELGITVLTLYPKSLQDILKDIKLVGEATGFDDEAKKLVENLQRRINLIEEENKKIPEEKRPRILWLMWYPELWTAGKGTFFDQLVKLAGGENVAFDLKGWKIISKETVLARDPQIILCSQMGTGDVLLKKIVEDPELSKIWAVKNGKVYEIDQNILERPGPRIVEALEKINCYINEALEGGR